MNVNQIALHQYVDCPPDMGDKGYRGIIVSFSETIHKNCKGVEYIWCSVKNLSNGNTSVWPSNRLQWPSNRLQKA